MAERDERPRPGGSVRGLLRNADAPGPSLWIPNAVSLVVATLLACSAVLGLAGLAGAHFDRALENFTGDPVTVAERDGCPSAGCGVVGFASNLGALTWAAAAIICLFVALALRLGARHPARRSPYLYFGILTGVLVLDDVFLFHETRWPFEAWLGESHVYAAYTLLALVIVVSFRAFLARTSVWILGLAVGFFGLSLVADVLSRDILGVDRHLPEDGAKLIGIALWALFFIGTAAVEVGRAISAPATEPADV